MNHSTESPPDDEIEASGLNADGVAGDEEPPAGVEERTAPGGKVVYHAIAKEGADELARSNSALAWSGLAAGLSMGFSFVTEALINHLLPADTAWRPLISKLGYGVGFLIVVLARQQLFTENTLTVILPLLRRWDRHTFLNVLRLWGLVLGTNLLGALGFALVVGHTSVFDADMGPDFAALGRADLAPAFGTLLLRGIFAGWLIALMVWLLPYAETARIWVILLITYVVGLGHFSHVIAGSVATLYLVVTGQCGVSNYLGGFLLPALIGNIVGGVSLVAALAHAQFVASED